MKPIAKKKRNLRADLAQARRHAFRRYERCAEILPKLHRITRRCDDTAAQELAERLYDWLVVPYTLWPIDLAGAADYFLAEMHAGRPVDADFAFLIELLGSPPKPSAQAQIADFEQYVKKGSYEHLTKCPEKFAALEEALTHRPKLEQAWAYLSQRYNPKKHEKNGVIRRRMSEERNFRSGLHFRWEKPDERFFELFDALCYRWQLYGMERGRPLLLKPSVNPTPHGTMIMVPRLLSLDGERDLKWKAIGRLHRAHGAVRQGPKASKNLAAMYKEAVDVAKHDAAGRKAGLKGERLTEYILDRMGHRGADDTWLKRRRRLLLGFD